MTVRQALFGFSGRIGRQVYFLGQALLVVIMTGILVKLVQEQDNQSALAAWGGAFMLFSFISIWSSLALTIKRLRDLSWPPILVVVMFIPTVNLGFALVLLALPSDPATNGHGPPASPPRPRR